MLFKCKAIVIKTIDYSENSVVLKCFTDTHGVQSYMVNGVRSKKGSIKPSHLLPLSLLELEAYHQQQKNLQRIKELKCSPQLQSLHFDMVKSSVGIFIAEVVNKVLREDNQPDPPLFSFMYHTIQLLDLEGDKVNNFPLFFLLQLTRYLGFHPKGLYGLETNGFDFREGIFEPYNARNPYQLTPSLSEKMSMLLQSNSLTYKDVSMNYADRTALLEHTIDYYREHITGFLDLKSHKVLAEVLG
jgi:DNA repair protein RecO (recombination protein O)